MCQPVGTREDLTTILEEFARGATIFPGSIKENITDYKDFVDDTADKIEELFNGTDR